MEEKEAAKETKSKAGKGEGRKREEKHKHKKKHDRGSKKVENRSSQTSELDLSKLPELAPLISSNPELNRDSQDTEPQRTDENAKSPSKSSPEPTKGSNTTENHSKGFKSRSIFDYKPSPVRSIAASDPDLCKASTSNSAEVSRGLASPGEEGKRTQASKRASDASVQPSVTSKPPSKSSQDTCQPSTSRDDTGNEAARCA